MKEQAMRFAPCVLALSFAACNNSPASTHVNGLDIEIPAGFVEAKNPLPHALRLDGHADPQATIAMTLMVDAHPPDKLDTTDPRQCSARVVKNDRATRTGSSVLELPLGKACSIVAYVEVEKGQLMYSQSLFVRTKAGVTQVQCIGPAGKVEGKCGDLFKSSLRLPS
jgi:hypothetical protein